MKKIFLLLSITPLLLLSSCLQNTQTAKEYHNSIYGSVDTIITYVFQFDNAIEANEKENAAEAYQQLKKVVDEKNNFVNEVGAYQGDAKFQDAALQLLGFYDDFVNDQFKQVLTYVQQDSLSPDDMDKMYSLLDDFYDDESPLLQTFKLADDEFVTKYRVFE